MPDDAAPPRKTPGARLSDDGIVRRAEREGDAPFREALFRETHGSVLAGLDPRLVDQLLAHQRAGQTMTYRAAYPDARYDIVEDDMSAPIGRMVVHQTSEAITLVDIALRQAWRGRGVGTRLLRDLLAEARAARVPVRLSVRPDNPAGRLYTRLGFVVIGATAVDLAMEWVP